MSFLYSIFAIKHSKIHCQKSCCKFCFSNCFPRKDWSIAKKGAGDFIRYFFIVLSAFLKKVIKIYTCTTVCPIKVMSADIAAVSGEKGVTWFPADLMHILGVNGAIFHNLRVNIGHYFAIRKCFFPYTTSENCNFFSTIKACNFTNPYMA